MSKVSRREFLVRIVQAGGVLGLGARSTWAQAGRGAMRSRRPDRQGGRLPPAPPGRRRELVGRPQGAGDHGAGRHGAAPLGAGHARRAGRHQGPGLPRAVPRPQGRAVRGPARELLDLDRPDGLPGGERGRPVRPASSRGARSSSSRCSGTSREGKGRDDAVLRRARATAAGTAGPTSRTPPFFIEALRDTGLPADDPALQKALVFVSRCQNLKSEFNDQPWAGKVNDGGFVYTAANGGDERRPGKTEPTAASARTPA